MESYVPQAFIGVARCHVVDKLQDGKTLVGLCTEDAQLLEFVDMKVNDCCDIRKGAQDIKIYTSYKPFQKYYLILCETELHVITRNDRLSIIKKYDNVERTEVQDRLCLGWPQVVIWKLNVKEPIVTEFFGNLSCPSQKSVPWISTRSSITPEPLHPALSTLNKKVQGMTVQLKNARSLLWEKRQARIKALDQLTANSHLPERQTQEKMMSLVVGHELPVDRRLLPSLQIMQPFRHVNNDKWVLGVPVYNSSNMTVEDVRLLLRMDHAQELKYETHVITFPKIITSGTDWIALCESRELTQTKPDIIANAKAVVVGVIEEPLLKSTEVVIHGSLVFMENCRSFQVPLYPVVEFKITELIQGSLQPFLFDKESCSVNDLISVTVTSSHWKLRVSSHNNLPKNLSITVYGMSETLGGDTCFGLHGSLLGLVAIHRPCNPHEQLVDLYAKDQKQGLQYVQSLLSNGYKVEMMNTAGAIDCVKRLAAELQMLLTVRSGRAITPEEWAKFRNQLNSLELETDLSFVSCAMSVVSKV